MSSSSSLLWPFTTTSEAVSTDMTPLSSFRRIANGFQLVQLILSISNFCGGRDLGVGMAITANGVQLLGYPLLETYWFVLCIWTASLPLDTTEMRLRVIGSWIIEAATFISFTMQGPEREVFFYLTLGIPLLPALLILHTALVTKYNRKRDDLCRLARTNLKVIAMVGIALCVAHVITRLATQSMYAVQVTSMILSHVMNSTYGIYVVFYDILQLSLDDLMHFRLPYCCGGSCGCSLPLQGIVLFLYVYGLACMLVLFLMNPMVWRHYDLSHNNNNWEKRNKVDRFYFQWEIVGYVVWGTTVVIWSALAWIAYHTHNQTTTSTTTTRLDNNNNSNNDSATQPFLDDHNGYTPVVTTTTGEAAMTMTTPGEMS